MLGPTPAGDFQPLGLANGSSLFFAVVRRTQPIPVGDVDPGPCDALLLVTGPEGNVLASMPTGPLAPGNAALLVLNANTLGLRAGERVEVQAFLRPAVRDSFTPGSAAGCVASAQLVDNLTQWTTALMGSR